MVKFVNRFAVLREEIRLQLGILRRTIDVMRQPWRLA